MKWIKRTLALSLVVYCFFFSDCENVIKQLEWMQAQRNMFFFIAFYYYIKN